MRSPRYTILIANRNTGVVRRFTVRPSGCDLGGAGHSGRSDAGRVGRSLVRRRLRSKPCASPTTACASRTTAIGPRPANWPTQISSLQTRADATGRAGTARPGGQSRAREASGQRQNRAMGGGSAADRAMPTINAASASTGTFGILRDLLGALDDRLKSVQLRGRSAAGAGRARRRRSGRLRRAGSRRRSASAPIRSPADRTSTPVSTSPPTAARPCTRRPTARSSRPATTATTATAS